MFIEPTAKELAFVMVMLSKIRDLEVTEISLCNGIDIDEKELRRHITIAQHMGADLVGGGLFDPKFCTPTWRCNNWDLIKDSVTGWLRERSYYTPEGEAANVD